MLSALGTVGTLKAPVFAAIGIELLALSIEPSLGKIERLIVDDSK